MDNKGESVQTPNLNSPCNAQNIQKSHDQKTTASSSPNLPKTPGFSTTNSSLDNKMNNVAKLRQQFVEEIKNIELSLKETIKNLKIKISETKNKTDIIVQKLSEANQLLCNQSEIIYMKEQENKVLRENVEELYELQKILFENVEDIFNTFNMHENFSEKLMNIYDNIISIQQNENTILEDKLRKIIPDEKLCVELNEINLQIVEFEKANSENEKEINKLETEIKAMKAYKEEKLKEIQEYEKRIHELEMRNSTSRENANKEKNNLISEIEKIDNNINRQKEDILNSNRDLSDLEIKLTTARNLANETEKNVEEINEKINLLTNELKELDEMQMKEDKENKITLEKLEEVLKNTKDELLSVKETETQATDILQRKIGELRIKVENIKNLEPKIDQLKAEIKTEQELINQITEECNDKTNEYNDKIKVNNEKIIDSKIKLNQVEHSISDSEEKIKTLEEEINLLNKKLEAQIKENEKSIENHTFPSSISNCGLPNLFLLDDIGNVEKQNNRKKLYTPTLADDDLELDALTLEEQFTRLTQSNSSQAESNEKNKKFFRYSQSKPKRESTPRSKGKNKKY